MGVPALFRWLCDRYRIVQPAIADSRHRLQPIDNLYLDMNCIIHLCCHPEGAPVPDNEHEIMYIDRLVAIVRPQKVLYIAMDGVVPRAKMPHQRSNRFYAVHRTKAIIEKRQQLESQGKRLPTPKIEFDLECINPGTAFMVRIADSLRSYIFKRLQDDPDWCKMQVILSDSNVPGEGEHKIMNFIRQQRAELNYDPNSAHCLYGNDADLIMLALASHEPNFCIIREEDIPLFDPCDICGQIGHDFKECIGLTCVSNSANVCRQLIEPDFIYVQVNVLRECLQNELFVPTFSFDAERLIDDWIFLTFFLGNDFLPNLPSIEVREEAMPQLVAHYKMAISKTQMYLTNDGNIIRETLQLLLTSLALDEPQTFVMRHVKNQRRNDCNQSLSTNCRTRKTPPIMETKDAEQIDDVCLWQDGYKSRFYKAKFNVDCKFIDVHRRTMAAAYFEGLCWMLKYYYTGCPSWTWFYPYHYAPFVSDFDQISDIRIDFNIETYPLRPLEQMMCLFPPENRRNLPIAWQSLMIDKDSPIIDYYPTDIKIDLNGKRHEWQAVLLLPFVNEQHVLDTLKSVYHLLNDDEKCRKVLGNDQIFFGPRHHLYSSVDSAIYANIDKHYLSLIDRMSDRKSTSIGIYRPKQRIIEEKEITRRRISSENFKSFKLLKQQHYQLRLLETQNKLFEDTIRVFHLEEMKVWKSISDEYRITSEKEWEQYEKDRVAKAISDRENAKATFARMERVRRDAEIFLQNVKDLHKDEFKKKMYEWQSRLETEKRARLQRRKDQRIKARREEWEQQQELEKQRRKEEDEARVREEETKRRQLRQDRLKRETRDREFENDGNFRSKPIRHSISVADSGPWIRAQQQPVRRRTSESDRYVLRSERQSWRRSGMIDALAQTENIERQQANHVIGINGSRLCSNRIYRPVLAMDAGSDAPSKQYVSRNSSSQIDRYGGIDSVGGRWCRAK